MNKSCPNSGSGAHSFSMLGGGMIVGHPTTSIIFCAFCGEFRYIPHEEERTDNVEGAPDR